MEVALMSTAGISCTCRTPRQQSIVLILEMLYRAGADERQLRETREHFEQREDEVRKLHSQPSRSVTSVTRPSR